VNTVMKLWLPRNAVDFMTNSDYHLHEASSPGTWFHLLKVNFLRISNIECEEWGGCGLILVRNMVYFILTFLWRYVMNIATYTGLSCLIIMGSGFDDWVYWHFFTITVNYNSPHIELLLNSLKNLSLN
jgi:hypothetical protein